MPALESLPGKIGPYRLLEKIGEGGMGVVYLARDAQNRTAAVKVLGPLVADDPDARRRLFREVETMLRVRSPYVAEVLDADVTGPAPYIATQYVPRPHSRRRRPHRRAAARGRARPARRRARVGTRRDPRGRRRAP
jgi:serine/threonine protein kinase